MPYGVNAGSVSNNGARWGIIFQGRNDGNDYGTDTSKSASIYAISEDTLGYNRQVGLAFYTSDFDANQTQRFRMVMMVKLVFLHLQNPLLYLELASSTVEMSDSSGLYNQEIHVHKSKILRTL